MKNDGLDECLSGELNRDLSDEKTLREFGIGATWRHWFGRGTLAGMMVAAAVNGLSYFARSEGVQNLIGASQNQQEAIGIPFEVWRRGQAYGTFIVDFGAFFSNCGLGFAFSLAVGIWAAKKIKSLNRLTVAVLRREERRIQSESGFQFSIKSMLIATTVIALFLGAILNVSPDPTVLAAIFFAGPWAMVGLAMLPPGIKWQHRVVMISIMSVAMIGVAIYVGQQLNKPFDEVLMGVFICWTPQSVIAICGLLAYLIYDQKPPAQNEAAAIVGDR